jgi:hypothetical protein
LILALGGLIGFAAFSTDAEPVPTTIVSGQLPVEADARIAAAAFLAVMRGTLTAPPVETTPPPTTTTSPAAPTTTVVPTTAPPSPRKTAPAAATTTRPPPPATTTTTAPPPPPPPTTTTTVAPATTTTTTVAPGEYDVEDWRPLVEQYFAPERVEEALRVMWCESRGNPTVVNDVSGAAGLFQFVPNTWGWASAEAGWAGASVFDPEANIASAAWLVQVSIDTDHAGGPWGHWSCQP